ncbi:30S ribosomal protein S17e [Candidatus Woesearchaeota archaeon]|nr:30S ribosomal protein S17e [Candidatus Woesearchaeota archaeon]
MGRIKTQLIKSSAIKVVRMMAGKLTNDYAENKKIMAGTVKTPSRKLRNAIVGYATRLVKTKRLE